MMLMKQLQNLKSDIETQKKLLITFFKKCSILIKIVNAMIGTWIRKHSYRELSFGARQ